MNEIEQRIAIVEACGWTWRDITGGWHNPEGSFVGSHDDTIPDYLHDLNAMAEATAILSDERWLTFQSHLAYVTGARGRKAKHVIIHLRKMIDATPSQRAEAFLRTIGKWKE